VGDGSIGAGDYIPSGSVIGTTSHSNTGGSDVSLDVTANIQNHISSLDEWAGFMITPSNSGSSTDWLQRTYQSSEAGIGFAPRLVITDSTPEPSSLGLLAAMLSFAALHRRRRS